MKLRIELLSDLCSGSGDVYNSSVDTDVVHDDYGFPYIPAKRLKGCLREACLELVEFGAVSREEYESLFGRGGSQSSRFTLGNAYLEEYEAMIDDVRSVKDSVLTHPQRVLGLYTYVRTQTAMTPEGAAKENSLRTIRVVKKGLVFEADLQTGEKEAKLLPDVAGMVKHIGMGRTRGLGLIQMQVISEEEKQDTNRERREFTADRYRIDYSVRLLEPAVFKSAEGNQARTLKYIEGSRILGMLAGILGQSAYGELMDIIVSNAYIAREVFGKSGREVRRCIPVAASLQKKKDQSYVKDQMPVMDMLFADGTVKEQMTPVGVLFVDEDGYVADVETEINYHHRRPADKAVGRADGRGDSAFYQLEGIRRGQMFSGYILADREQAEKIYDALTEKRNIRIGQGRTAEYGAAYLTVEDVKPVERTDTAKDQTEERIHDFVLKLNAPAILYNEYGVPSAEPAVLREYLAEALGNSDLRLQKSFLRFETVGGFNVTWNRRKPVFTALGSGTVCFFHSDKGVAASRLGNCFLGERISEGYGEVAVERPGDQHVVLRRADKTSMIEGLENEGNHYRTDIVRGLWREQEKLRIEADAREDARTKENLRNREIDAVIGKMILLGKTEETPGGMKSELEGIEKTAKRELALRLFKPIEDYIRTYIEENGEKWWNEKAVFRIYNRAYLNQLKYQFRPGREERRKQHG